VRFLRSASPRAYLSASAVFAILTGLVLHSYVSGAAGALPSASAMAQVVVVASPASRGVRLVAKDLRVVRMPVLYAPPGALSSISQAAGRVTLTDLLTGEPVTKTRLARVRAGPVASLIPEGLRAFAVPSTLPAGTVAPGDHVDVLATYGGGQPHTETVVSGVEVLMVLGPAGSSGAISPASGAYPSGGGFGGGSGPAADAAASGVGFEPTTLLLLAGLDQEQRLAYARAFADLEVVVAPAVDEP
jgi:Flp pilus assembly protein CpaB